MINKQNKIAADAAWKKLYGKLKADGLIPVESEQKGAYTTRPLYYKWVAVFVVLCASAAALFINTKPTGADRQDLLTLQNKKGAVTLVTTLEDGSIIYLGDDAQLDYPARFEKNIREVYLSGNALFDVSGNKERPFLIETKDILVKVLGTSFYIKDKDNTNFELAVQRGRVQVTHKKSGKETFVESGETVRLLSGSLLVTPTKDSELFKQYTEKIQFKDELLVNILRVVNKKSENLILETTPELGNRLLTVTFSNNSPERIAQYICLALDLTYTEKNGVLFISDIN